MQHVDALLSLELNQLMSIRPAGSRLKLGRPEREALVGRHVDVWVGNIVGWPSRT